MKTIKIKRIYRTDCKPGDTVPDGRIYVNVVIADESAGKEDVLWYSIDKRFEKFVCDERCDAFVTNIFMYAFRFKYDVIESEYPISEQLYYNLTYHVIPQLYERGNGVYPRIRIDAPKTKLQYNGRAVAAGLSRGVDSFATLYEYGKSFELPDYRITHFTYYNAGAHHGFDGLTGRSKYSKEELYRLELADTVAFCEKYGYELIVVNSNLNSFLRTFFGFWGFNRTHTYRNLGITMLLQKGISKYYYSSAFNLSEFEFSLNTDTAKYEKWLMHHLCTENIVFYNSNQEWSRIEKVERMAELEESYDFLNVCLIDNVNCGECTKCKRTLMELDAFGDEILDRYHNSFDLETYRSKNRRLWFGSIWEMMESPTIESGFAKEIFTQALKTHPSLIGEPLDLKFDNTIQFVRTKSNTNFRALPDAKSMLYEKIELPALCEYLGEYGDWYKVSYRGKIGYINKVKLIAVKELERENGVLFICCEEEGKLRKLPSKLSKVLHKIETPVVCEYLGEYGDWYKVSIQGKTGYINRLKVQPVKDLHKEDGVLFIHCEKEGKLCELPSKEAMVLQNVETPMVCEYLGECSDWYKVSIQDKTGYINRLEVTPVKDLDKDESALFVCCEKEGKLRKLPSKASKVLKKFEATAVCEYLGEYNDWYMVSYHGKMGFVNKLKATVINELNMETDAQYVLCENEAVVRALPTRSADVILKVTDKVQYEYLGGYKKWIRIGIDGAPVGYIHKANAKIVYKNTITRTVHRAARKLLQH